MTFEEFKKLVDENRFIVKRVSETKYEIYTIEVYNGKYYLRRYVNRKAKDGRFTARGYGYSKPIHVIEQFASQYGKEYLEYFQKKQNLIPLL